MNYGTKEQFGQNAAVELDETELETITASMHVRTGIRAGLLPCI